MPSPFCETCGTLIITQRIGSERKLIYWCSKCKTEIFEDKKVNKEAFQETTLINHSEKQLPLHEVHSIVKKTKEVGLISVVCANTPEVASKVAAFRPDIVAVEPPELIGTGIPVSKAKPEVVTDTVSLVRKVDSTITILCGAGITKGADVSAALDLGTEGVLIASGIVKAKDPREALLDIVKAMK